MVLPRAPVQAPDGTLQARDRGTPQGSAISPLLANLFMHYTFDAWLARTQPQVRFERYCDDVIVHCASNRQAAYIRNIIAARLKQFGLTLHPDKTKIVYCKQEGLAEFHPVTEFTFLGYTFRPRGARTKYGETTGRVPPSRQQGRHEGHGPRDPGMAARTPYRPELPRHRHEDQPHRGRMDQLLRALLQVTVDRLPHPTDQPPLGQMGHAEVQHLHRNPAKARRRLAQIASTYKGMFVHWRHGALPSGSTTGAV
jgi:RNA-directed DNA polymerase